MDQILFAVILSFLITLFAIPKIINVSEKKNLFDNPDVIRKLHSKPLSSLGGVGIFLGFVISILFTGDFFKIPEFKYYLISFIIIFFIGIKDDIVTISAFKKFTGQSLIACILMFKAGLLITNVHGFFGLTNIYPIFSFLLTFFTFIVVINAFNLIDGVDGLAAGLGLLSSLVFGTFFMLNHNTPYAILGFGYAGSLIAFLIYNYQPAKIFMGDSGSLLMGVVNSILVIKFIQNGTGNIAFSLSAVPAIAFSILLIPLMDTLRVFGIRIFNGRSPFCGDRNHIHHLLLERGFSHKNIMFICAGMNLLFICAAFLLKNIGTTWLVAGLIGCFFIVIYSIQKIPVKFIMRVIKKDMNIRLNSEVEDFAPARIM